MAIWVRPCVTATTHVEGCNRRHCGPGCVRVTDGFEYHLKLKLPNGELHEERKKSPASGKSTTQRYAEERSRHLVRFGLPDKTAAAPTVEELRARCIREHCEVSRLRPSTIAQKNVILDHYIKSRLGDRRLDQIRDPDIARLKADLKDLSPKTVNNVLVTLELPPVSPFDPCPAPDPTSAVEQAWSRSLILLLAPTASGFAGLPAHQECIQPSSAARLFGRVGDRRWSERGRRTRQARAAAPRRYGQVLVLRVCSPLHTSALSHPAPLNWASQMATEVG